MTPGTIDPCWSVVIKLATSSVARAEGEESESMGDAAGRGRISEENRFPSLPWCEGCLGDGGEMKESRMEEDSCDVARE